MLPETASSLGDRPVVRAAHRDMGDETSALHDELRQMVMRVFMIEREQFTFDEQTAVQVMRHQLLVDPNSRLSAIFEGRLLTESEPAYDQLDSLFATVDHVPVFRQDGEKQVIYAVSGRSEPKPRPVWLNWVLFLATIFSVLWVGTESAINEIAATNLEYARSLLDTFVLELWRGIPYAVAILLILGAHELGHYFAARRHGLAVTLPYFIPAPPFLLPTPFGTFGAFIQLRQAMRSRKVLFDVGAAGPFMGLVFAIPIVLIGLATSPVKQVEPGIAFIEGNSLLYALAKTIVFQRFLPANGEDVFLNQIAWAGWAGLLVTALNLIPIGQLDGGHILYALIGKRARLFYYPLMGVVLLLSLRSETWILWFVLLLLFGRMYAAPLDDITPLDPRRRIWGIVGLVVFAVTFVPEPLSAVTIPELGDRQTVMVPIMFGLLALWTTRRVWATRRMAFMRRFRLR
ncbi:MAG: site-2 protease family protein [bacterium]|nr:site-2 protease family protein [bacterium]